MGAFDEEPPAAGAGALQSAAPVLTDDAAQVANNAEPSALPILAEEPVAAEAGPSTAAPAAASRPLFRWLSWLVPILAWTGISAYFYGHFVAHPTAGVPGGPDGVIYVWFFKSVEQALAHLSNPLVSHAMNAPTGVSLVWNTSVLPLAVLLAPLTPQSGRLRRSALRGLRAPCCQRSQPISRSGASPSVSLPR